MSLTPLSYGSNASITALEQLPNPFTPLAFLSPFLAGQIEDTRYTLTVTLGAYVWDLAINLNSDYYLLLKHKVRFPTVLYYFSRVSTLVYIICNVIYQFGRIGHCQTLQVIRDVFLMLSGVSTGLLFFHRVQAVFRDHRYIIAFFSFLCLSVLAGFFTVPFAIKGTHIGPTQACVNTIARPYAGAAVVTAFVNEILVYLAVSYRILVDPAIHDNTIKGELTDILERTNSHTLYQAFLQGGQQYYLAAVAANVVHVVIIFSRSVPSTEHAIFTVPYMAVVNVMACVVFRQVKFGLVSSDGSIRSTKSTLSAHNGIQFVPQRAAENSSIDNHGIDLTGKLNQNTQFFSVRTVSTDAQTPSEKDVSTKIAQLYSAESGRETDSN